ncbi:MAG TPA: hypothetical protein DEQ34_00780 [Balneolaceae bacterium]|nr:hypothetical protein [Balneolaceae bacterium]|tara:strand:+ start:28338 stop:28808 length:471 start_codon:yes stop_codon:yes gene_type:complete
MAVNRHTSFIIILIFIMGSLTACLENGASGPAGPAGEDGLDGVDGNANVIIKTVEPASGEFFNWTESVYLNQPANRIAIPDTALNQLAVNTDFIRVDVQFGDAVWYPLPVSLDSGSVITFSVQVDTLNIYAYKPDSVFSADIDFIRYFIIESTSSN